MGGYFEDGFAAYALKACHHGVHKYINCHANYNAQSSHKGKFFVGGGIGVCYLGVDGMSVFHTVKLGYNLN